MARQRKEKEVKIKLKQPDRSGPDPSKETLLALAERQGLLKVPEIGDESEEEDENEPPTGRLADSILWSISLTMLHFTLDVLVTHQYAVEISWPIIVTRAAQAFPSKPSPQSISRQTSTQKNSHPPPRLLLPPTPLALDFSTSAPTKNTTAFTPSPFLRLQRSRRMLFDPRLE
jgi:hypothetical protein